MDEKLASEINAFVEYYWNRMEDAPGMERLRSEFPRVETKALEKQLKLALQRMQLKGYGIQTRNYLSPEQLALANSLLNLSDRRSAKKKMDDLKVSPAVFANWQKDPTFNEYLRERSESVLGNGVSTAHLALVDSAASGDIQAIKLLYEITGRHSPGSQQIVNVKSMLIRVIEAVQKHVNDPQVLQAIAGELQGLGEGIFDEGPVKPLPVKREIENVDLNVSFASDSESEPVIEKLNSYQNKREVKII